MRCFRSIRKLPSKNTKDAVVEWDDLTFRFGPRAFLYADLNRIVGYASTSVEAERLVEQFSKTYAKPAESSGGVFYLIEQGQNDIRCQEVTLSPETILSDEALRLHYGGGTGEWHLGFVEKLHGRISGLSILEGGPGTGKTFYLRHLMGVLRDSQSLLLHPNIELGCSFKA